MPELKPVQDYMPSLIICKFHRDSLKNKWAMPRTKSITNMARSEHSSHTVITGRSHQRLQHFQRKDKIVKDFITLNKVVSEKALMKNVHMCYIRDRRKN